jgi:hypothetical protein
LLLLATFPLVLHSGQGAVVVFDNIPEVGQTGYNASYISHSYQAHGTFELGNSVNLAGTARKLQTVTVTMVTHANANDWQALYTANPVGWNHDLTLTVWTANAGQVLTSKKLTTLVPWNNPVGGNDGSAFNVSFDFSSDNITLPNTVLVSLAFNTQNIGPFDSLNYGTFEYAPFTGSDVTPGEVMRIFSANTNNIVFETAPGWTNRTPMMEITATQGSPYDTWIATYSNYSASVAPGRRTDDPDGDGLNNLAEFAFGQDPTLNSPNPITIARSNTLVTIQWLQRNDGSVNYTNRSTTNFTTGFPVGNSTNFVAALSTNTNNLPRAEYSRHQFSTNISGFLRHFYKVDAQEVP